MDDSERLDAIGEYGLCIAAHDTLKPNGWERTWVCQYGPDMKSIFMAPTIREAIDGAVLDLEANHQLRH